MKGEGGKRRQAPWLHQHGQDVGEARHTVPCTLHKRADLAKPGEDRVVSLCKVPIGNGTKYLDHCGIVKGVNGEDIEVPCETACDGVPPSSRGTHGCNRYL